MADVRLASGAPLPGVLQRIQAALEADVHAQPGVPQLHTVPAILLRWDFGNGILRIGHAMQSELEVHICYLRICDLQITIGKMIEQAGAAHAAGNPKLKAIANVMSGLPPKLQRVVDS